MDQKQTHLKASDFKILDRVFQMESGYVLDFSNTTFAQFFADELRISIDDPKYSSQGNSKAKRLRYFLRISEPNVALATLLKLWDYRVEGEKLGETEGLSPEIQQSFASIIKRLGGNLPQTATKQPHVAEAPIVTEQLSQKLNTQLMELTALTPQARGYAYEKFLKNTFDAYELDPRASFRNIGEQIDGSFVLGNDTYLLEAKWQNEPTGAADLHVFEGKLREKADWSRGLFVSNSGFSQDGIVAVGRAKRFVCMDGYDFSEMLSRRISFVEVIKRKVRRAVETGSPFCPVRELFP